MGDSPKPVRPAPDWERIELDFRAGILSLREMSGAHGISHVSIAKRAKRDGWDRNLSAKIHAKADALVNRAMVNSAANSGRLVTEREVVDGGAERIAQVRGSHRADIGRARALTMALLVELECQTGNLPGLVALGEILRSPNEFGADKLNDIYQAVLSLPERTKTVKALSEALKNLVGMEREAYNIGAVEVDPASKVASGLSHFYGESE